MSRYIKLAPPEVCLRIYYEASGGEVGNDEIRELLCNNAGVNTIVNIKHKALEVMARDGKKPWGYYKVDIDALFEVLGLDLKRLERNRKRLAEMGRREVLEQEG